MMRVESDGRLVDLRCWKFTIPGNDARVVETYPDGSTLRAQGCCAIAIAESEEAARALLTRIANEQGDDSRWLSVASVTILDLDAPKRLCWVML